MVDSRVLYRVELFDGLENGDIKQISKICKTVEVPKGQKIFSRGSTANDLYLVKSGRVHIRFHVSILLAEQEIDVDVLEAGDVLGWSALVEPYTLTLTAVAQEDCELFQIRGKDFLSLCSKRPKMGYIVMSNLVKVVASRFSRIQHMLQKEIELNVPSMEGKH